jgi:sugar phosphate permease
MFDFGTIIGGLFIGYISDLLQKRFIIMEIFVSVSVVGFLMAAF